VTILQWLETSRWLRVLPENVRHIIGDNPSLLTGIVNLAILLLFGIGLWKLSQLEKKQTADRLGSATRVGNLESRIWEEPNKSLLGVRALIEPRLDVLEKKSEADKIIYTEANGRAITFNFVHNLPEAEKENLGRDLPEAWTAIRKRAKRQNGASWPTWRTMARGLSIGLGSFLCLTGYFSGSRSSSNEISFALMCATVDRGSA